jgi:hypothetical protein
MSFIARNFGARAIVIGAAVALVAAIAIFDAHGG